MTPISLARIATAFERRTLARARSYVDRVTMLSQVWPFEALVEGESTYRTTLDEVDGVLQGECSCPVGIDCKHAAAVALWVADESREGKKPRLALNEWLASLSASQPPNASATSPSTTQTIVYLLRSEASRVVLQVGRCSRRKDGSLGSPKIIDYPGSWVFNQRRIADRDRRLILTLDACQPKGHTTRELSTEHLSPHVFNELIESGRLFWAAQASPLSIGPSRTQRLTWKPAAKGHFRIGADAPIEIAAGDWPHYIDPATGQVGPIDLGVPAATLIRLLAAPPIEKSVLPDLARGLDELIGVEIESTQRVPALKKPLELRAAFRISSEASQGTLEINLKASYGDRTYPLANSSEGDGPRDLCQEAAALAYARQISGDLVGGLVYYGPEERAELSSRIAHDIAPALAAEGWVVALPDGLEDEMPMVVDDVVGAWEELDGNGWFQFSLGVEVGGKAMPLLPILLAALQDPKNPIDLGALRSGGGAGLHLEAGKDKIYIPRKRIAEWLAPLLELQRHDLEDDGSLRLSPSALIGLATALPEEVGMFGDSAALTEIRQKVASLIALEEKSEPKGFKGELRSYQRLGLAWLGALHRDGFGGILADDMGLGKTIQLLAFLEERRAAKELDGHPVLVVAPRSVIENWQSEATKFTPKLRTVLHHGPSRATSFEELGNAHVIISSYQTIVRDTALFDGVLLGSLILDEAQAIKNATTRVAKAMRGLSARSRFCVTGTPIENRLIELWSQFEVAMPGLLGTRKGFQKRFCGTDGDIDLLRRRIRPFMLRREKAEVETSLPPITEVIVPIEIVGKQRDLYETTRLALERQVRESLKARGAKGSAIVVLDALLKIRQVCCDPRLVKSESARDVKTSAKLERLLSMLTELSEAGRATLVFSQFASMLAIIEEECQALGIKTTKLTGKTRKRTEAIARFNSGEANVFLISLKAGGVGLNLTRADTVIHYDPWWNPAAEAQATDRAHRIGQDKPVFVYKLIGEGTVEERVVEMQESKRQIANAALSHGGVEHLGAADLQALFESL